MRRRFMGVPAAGLRAIPLALALILTLPRAARAQTDPAGPAYSAAQAIENSGQFAAAIDGYRRVAAAHPDSPYGMEAAFRVAVILDDHLQDLPGALSAYRDFLGRFPSSRHVDRAEQRIAALQRYESVDPDAYRAFNTALQVYTQRDPAPAIAMMEAFIRDYPDYQRLDDALLWLANEYKGYKRELADAGGDRARLSQAMALYQRVIDDYPGTESRVIAWKNLGDCHRMLGAHREAHRCYARVEAEGGERARALIGQYRMMTDLDAYRNRTLAAVVVLIPLFLLALWRLVPFSPEVVRRGLRRSLLQVGLFAPLATFLVAMTFRLTDPTKGNIIGSEPWLMLVIMVVVLLALLLNNVVLAADAEKPVRMPLYLMVLVGLIVSITYAAFYSLGLLTYVEKLVL